MGKRIELVKGQKFGMLTYLAEAGRIFLPSGQSNRIVLVQCDCGTQKEVRLLHLIRERMISCGCIKPQPHGMSGTQLHNTWRGMTNRCRSDKYIDHHRYKDRGITVCEDWKKFIPFRDWALSHGYINGLELDRIDNNKGYYPENCRFVTQIENVNNREMTVRIKYNGKIVPLMEVVRNKNLVSSSEAIRSRIHRGWTAQEAIDTPIRQGNYKRK